MYAQDRDNTMTRRKLLKSEHMFFTLSGMFEGAILISRIFQYFFLQKRQNVIELFLTKFFSFPGFSCLKIVTFLVFEDIFSALRVCFFIIFKSLLV